LVHPRGSNWFPGRRDITDIANRMVPQGMLSIAAYLIRQGHEVFVYDCLGPGVPVDIHRQVQAILAFQPQMIGFSTTTSSFPDAEYRAKNQRTKARYRHRVRRRSCLRA
jgi:anaerobic magnesium-protoporphyrin IX monomethyl ester cyclase